MPCLQRFKSVDAEFVQLMRRVAHKPNIMEVHMIRAPTHGWGEATSITTVMR